MESRHAARVESWHRPRGIALAANGLILGLWLWLHRAVFGYLAIIFTRSDFRTNQVLLVGVIALIVWQGRRQGTGVRIAEAPQLFVPALALALGGSLLYLLVEQRQEELLDELEAHGDRFEREYEPPGETQGQNVLSVTGVPEPEEWLLLGLAAAMLLGVAYRTRLSAHRMWAG